MKLTIETLKILKYSIQLINTKKPYIIIKPIHLLISLILNENFISKLFFDDVKYKLFYINNDIKNNKNKTILFSNESLIVLNFNSVGKSFFTTIDLFNNLINLNDSEINKLFIYLNLNKTYIKSNFIEFFFKKNYYLPEKFSNFTNNLNTNIHNNIINTKETTNLLNIIIEDNNKNNIILIGDKGIGKKSIIYKATNKFIENKDNYIILELKLNKLLSFLKVNNNLENYLNNFLNYLSKNHKLNYIILISDIHLLLKHNDTEINNNLENILKYYSEFNNIKFILTTNKNNYKILTENKESFLNNSFIEIYINEFSNNIIKNIINMHLKKIINIYNIYFFNIDFIKLIELTKKHISTEKNPIKILKLIDYLLIKKLNSIDNIKQKNKYNNFILLRSYLDNYFLKINKIFYNFYLLKWKKLFINFYNKNNILLINNYLIKNNIVLNNNYLNLKNNNIFKHIYNFKYLIYVYMYYYLNFINKYKKYNNFKNNNIIELDKITLKYISDYIKLPIDIVENEINKTVDVKNKIKNYIKLEKTLKKRIFGQSIAIEQVLNSIKKNNLGLKIKNKPIGSYIFAGMSGTGKTELAKSLAEGLFGNENNMIRFDMSEFMEKHSISRLIGSPPGYIGHEEGGQLTNYILKKPYSIILLDEIEKAHPDVNNLLLQLLDDGRLTDSKGNLIDFSNTIIILTTNLGSPKNLNEYPYLKTNSTLSKTEFNNFITNTNKEIEKFFRPEFLNRLNSIIIFKPLEIKELKQIMFKFIEEFNYKLKLNNFPIIFFLNKNFINLILKISYKPLYGARPLKRMIEKIIEKPINELLLFFNIKFKIIIYFYINIVTNKPMLTILKTEEI